MLKIGFCGVHNDLPMEVFEKLLNNPNVEVVGAFDTDAAMLEQMEKKAETEIRLFTDYGCLLDEVEAIVIYNSPEFFIRVRQAMEAKVHIMYELPRFTSEDDIKALLKLLVDHWEYKRVFAACFPRRYDAIFSGLSVILPRLEEEYGALTNIAINTRLFPPVEQSGYSLFMDRFIHDADALNFLLGQGSLSYGKVLKKKRNYSVKGTFISANDEKRISIQLDTFYVKSAVREGVQIFLKFASGETAEYRNFGMPKNVSIDKCLMFNKSFINMVNGSEPAPSGAEIIHLLTNVLAVAQM